MTGTSEFTLRNTASFVRIFLLLLLTVIHRLGLTAGPDSLILTRPGNLPILLTVPHGGASTVPNVPLRNSGTTVTDAYTLETAEAVAKQLERALGAQPYFVAARFSRKYIDANRAAAEAYETPAAKPVYDAYHREIARYVAELRERFPQGALLLDIHGQGDAPDVVHRGTRNGATVAALLRRHGNAALTGPDSVPGALAGRGYRVFPPNTPPGNPPEHRGYSGGHTVHLYGSGGPAGIDAIQLELGRALRTDARFGVALGDAITVFCRAYLAGEVAAVGASRAD